MIYINQDNGRCTLRQTTAQYNQHHHLYLQPILFHCVCVYNPKALQREFVRPNSRRVENGRKVQRKANQPAKRKDKGKANNRGQGSKPVLKDGKIGEAFVGCGVVGGEPAWGVSCMGRNRTCLRCRF